MASNSHERPIPYQQPTLQFGLKHWFVLSAVVGAGMAGAMSHPLGVFFTLVGALVMLAGMVSQDGWWAGVTCGLAFLGAAANM